MSMNHDKVTELLKNYRSYRYAANNFSDAQTCKSMRAPLFPSRVSASELNAWDAARYHRIVNMIDGAVNEVLSDEERTVIMRKYLDRNTLSLTEIADIMHKEQSTVSRRHTSAIRRLAIALMPLSTEEREISNFDHIFDPTWTFREMEEARA